MYRSTKGMIDIEIRKNTKIFKSSNKISVQFHVKFTYNRLDYYYRLDLETQSFYLFYKVKTRPSL